MKKSKKSLKGMTLIEMIISIAIFAIMGGLLVLVGTHIDATNRATNVLKSKVSNESPYAANHKTSYLDKDGNAKELTPDNINVEIKLDDTTVLLEAEKYNTEDVVTDGLSNADKEAMKKKANGGLNLSFVKYKTTPAADPGETPADPDAAPADPDAAPADPDAALADPDAAPADPDATP
ncbi:type II secretion system protein [Ruminococcus sp.]|uniref:type II secretion system protein n=1 Tax=Ruminococcus sp. TaxID=41978 RepID=UPI0025D772D6|nr:type II secretion system protein [Ruminococcus sp.]MCR4638450.1 type II secretion system GspH family protein [Ruminococcus sp.]